MPALGTRLTHNSFNALTRRYSERSREIPRCTRNDMGFAQNDMRLVGMTEAARNEEEAWNDGLQIEKHALA